MVHAYDRYSHPTTVRIASLLTAEIDRVMKKVDEGCDLFDEIWLKGKFRTSMLFGSRCGSVDWT